MKGLFRTVVILVGLIAVGMLISLIMAGSLDTRLAAAHDRGAVEGKAQGYLASLYEGHKAGFQDGSKMGYAMARGEQYSYEGSHKAGLHFAYNPTYYEVQEILAESNAISAREINDYAEANGIRTAYVWCQIAREAGEETVYVYHLVAFETVDKGLVVIEPLSYRTVKMELGQRYSELNGSPVPPHDDTIIKITIIW